MRFLTPSGHHLEAGDGNSIARYVHCKVSRRAVLPYPVQVTCTTQCRVWVFNRLRHNLELDPETAWRCPPARLPG